MSIYSEEEMFGRVIDPPEPVTCDGEFDKDKCICCVGYDKCMEEKDDGKTNDRPGHV